ncbi:MAG: hypothetical protein HKN21_12530, partial [Candidatus Eisenbacteria bacterium]|nr:hypothetical protein [Candidatus Eisenbacteria bacterium]
MIDFRNRTFLKSLGVVLVAASAVSVMALPASAQQLSAERLFLLAPQVTSGSGTIRLDGMGGFETAVPDENLEISMWDFGNNPAGFSQDRDSWNLEFRYGHAEFAERDRRLSGNDLSINDGTVRGGFYSRDKIGVGAQLDYAEVSTNSFSRVADSFRLSGFRVDGNTYLSEKLSLGARIGLSAENQEEFSSSVYRINHDNTSLRGGLGVSYDLVEGVKVGARGELIGTTVDGQSRGPFHTDNFDWSRPGGLVAVHGFLSRGRLQGGVDFTNQEINGEESVRISWSERFIFNPTPDELSTNLDTFTEKRTNEQLRTRWRLSINPRLSVSLATQN